MYFAPRMSQKIKFKVSSANSNFFFINIFPLSHTQIFTNLISWLKFMFSPKIMFYNMLIWRKHWIRLWKSPPAPPPFFFLGLIGDNGLTLHSIQYCCNSCTIVIIKNIWRFITWCELIGKSHRKHIFVKVLIYIYIYILSIFLKLLGFREIS